MKLARDVSFFRKDAIGMKKLRFLPLLVLAVFASLCAIAFATNIPGQQSIAYITDENGYVTSLTDDDATTAWSKPSDGGVDLTLHLQGNSVGEIWIRSGYAYTQNWYNHYDRPDAVKVTVYYQANRYTESYDTYRYRLTDAFRPNTVSDGWNSGYQRLLLPKQYTGVTRIELTIESTCIGYGRTGATIADIAIAAGSHATATPKAYATATPKPYVVYVTPTPGPETEEDDYVTYITPIPDDDDYADEGHDYGDYVEFITPRPTNTPSITIVTAKPTTAQTERITPQPTEPLVELLTPAPTSAPVDYPSVGGLVTTLAKRVATRSGPGTRFDEPGSFFSAGDEVKVFSKVYDEYNNVYWYQIEFQYKNEWFRAYTSESYLNIDGDLIPDEPAIYDPIDTQKALKKTYVYFGPGENYKMFTASVVHVGTKCDIYAIEDGWVQIEYTDYGSPEDPQPQRRGWVPLDVLYEYDN